LDNTTSPFNATVAAAMPGVREEFAVTRQVVNVMGAQIMQCFADNQRQSSAEQKEYINHLFSRMNHQHARFHQQAANLFNSGGGESSVRATIATATTTMAIPPGPGGATTSAHPANLQGNYSSLVDMWDEWHGRGRFVNQPVPGGFDVLEREKRAGWRKHLTNSEEQDVSRIKRLVDATNQYAKNTNKEGDEKLVLLEWDVLFQANGCSIRKLVELFQSDAYKFITTRKPRGKNA
jgi:hypothetical protein